MQCTVPIVTRFTHTWICHMNDYTISIQTSYGETGNISDIEIFKHYRFHGNRTNFLNVIFANHVRTIDHNCFTLCMMMKPYLITMFVYNFHDNEILLHIRASRENNCNQTCYAQCFSHKFIQLKFHWLPVFEYLYMHSCLTFAASPTFLDPW